MFDLSLEIYAHVSVMEFMLTYPWIFIFIYHSGGIVRFSWGDTMLTHGGFLFVQGVFLHVRNSQVILQANPISLQSVWVEML